MEYKMVSCAGAEEFNKLVNELIKKEYRPIGGVAISYCTRNCYCVYAQALVKIQ